MEAAHRQVILGKAVVLSAATIAQLQVVAYSPATQSTGLFA